MKKIATIALVLIFIGAIPISCNLLCGGCGCGDIDVKDFTITSFGLRTTNSLNEDIDTMKAYPFDAVYKMLDVTEMEFVARHAHTNNLFINTVSACSPVESKATEHFQEIEILASSYIALADENDHIGAGENITDRFEIAYSYTIDFKSIDSFIKDMADIHYNDSYRIRLSKKPFKETHLNLKFSILMTNGKTFEFDNQIMKVN